MDNLRPGKAPPNFWRFTRGFNTLQLIGVTQTKLHALFWKCKETAIEGEVAQTPVHDDVLSAYDYIELQALH